MSNEATTWAQAQKVGNSPAKFVLTVLADYASNDWSCYPSVAKIAQITELGESTVRKSLALLVERGLIKVFGRYRKDGSQRSSRYQLLVMGDETPDPDAEDWAYTRAVPEGWVSEREGGVSEREGGSLAQRPGGVSEREAIPLIDPSPKEPSPMVPAASRPKIATRIPDDFYPDAQMQAWFRERGYDRIIPNPKAAHEDFMDYWRAKGGADARKVDWPATWRRWMRTTADRVGRTGYGGNGNGPRLQSTTDMKVQQTLDLAEQFRQMEETR